MSFLLTPEQVAFRNAKLVENLRSTYPQVSNYSDEQLVAAYDDWFMSADATHENMEEDFIKFIVTEDI
jgi:hypothetical protein